MKLLLLTLFLIVIQAQCGNVQHYHSGGEYGEPEYGERENRIEELPPPPPLYDSYHKPESEEVPVRITAHPPYPLPMLRKPNEVVVRLVVDRENRKAAHLPPVPCCCPPPRKFKSKGCAFKELFKCKLGKCNCLFSKKCKCRKTFLKTVFAKPGCGWRKSVGCRKEKSKSCHCGCQIGPCHCDKACHCHKTYHNGPCHYDKACHCDKAYHNGPHKCDKNCNCNCNCNCCKGDYHQKGCPCKERPVKKCSRKKNVNCSCKFQMCVLKMGQNIKKEMNKMMVKTKKVIKVLIDDDQPPQQKIPILVPYPVPVLTPRPPAPVVPFPEPVPIPPPPPPALRPVYIHHQPTYHSRAHRLQHVEHPTYDDDEKECKK